MCYQVVERFSVCRCLYHRHAVDPCQAYGQRGHVAQEKTVLVGYACPKHASRAGVAAQVRTSQDSGYSSSKGGFY